MDISNNHISDVVVLSAVLSVMWLMYFAVHSILASLSCKRFVLTRRPALMRYYRLLYNLFATITLLPPVAFLYLYAQAPLWQWQGVGWWITNGLALVAVLGFYHSSRYYNMREFLGLEQLSGKSGENEQPKLGMSPYHRWVRHPWYFFGLVIVWTRSMDALMLVTAICISIYFIVGSRLEDRKLIAEFGDSYNKYILRVPGLIPLPWKHD